jgi:hypothetical protein
MVESVIAETRSIPAVLLCPIVNVIRLVVDSQESIVVPGIGLICITVEVRHLLQVRQAQQQLQSKADSHTNLLIFFYDSQEPVGCPNLNSQG